MHRCTTHVYVEECPFLYSFLSPCVLIRLCILLHIPCIFHNNTYTKLQPFHGVMATSTLSTETQPLLPASAPARVSTAADHDEEPRSIPLGFLIIAIAGDGPQKLIGQSNTSAYTKPLNRRVSRKCRYISGCRNAWVDCFRIQ